MKGLMKEIGIRDELLDNYRNMVSKLEKGSNSSRRAPQHSKKAQPLKKQQKAIEDQKIEYARIPHIKNCIGYKTVKGEYQWSIIHQVHQRQLSSSEARPQSN
jgi:hypothetical protein